MRRTALKNWMLIGMCTLIFSGCAFLFGSSSQQDESVTEAAPEEPASSDPQDTAACAALCLDEATCIKNCLVECKVQNDMAARYARSGYDSSSQDDFPGQSKYSAVIRKLCAGVRGDEGERCTNTGKTRVNSLLQAPETFYVYNIQRHYKGSSHRCLGMEPFQPWQHEIRHGRIIKRHKAITSVVESCETVLKKEWATLAQRGASRLGPTNNGKESTDRDFVPSKSEGEVIVAEILAQAPALLEKAKAELKVIAEEGILEQAKEAARQEKLLKERKAAAKRQRAGASEAMKNCCRNCGGSIVGEACKDVNFECWNRNACGTL